MTLNHAHNLEEPIPLDAPGFFLRPWQAEDETAIARHANNRQIWLNLQDSFPHPYGPAQARKWIRHAHKAAGLFLAISHQRQAVGSISLAARDDVMRHSALLGYWLAVPCWGRGVMSSAVATVTRLGLCELGYTRLYAHVFAPNRASARVLEKAGYALEGRLKKAVLKNGKLLDQLVYGIVKG